MEEWKQRIPNGLGVSIYFDLWRPGNESSLKLSLTIIAVVAMRSFKRKISFETWTWAICRNLGCPQVPPSFWPAKRKDPSRSTFIHLHSFRVRGDGYVNQVGEISMADKSMKILSNPNQRVIEFCCNQPTNRRELMLNYMFFFQVDKSCQYACNKTSVQPTIVSCALPSRLIEICSFLQLCILIMGREWKRQPPIVGPV